MSFVSTSSNLHVIASPQMEKLVAVLAEQLQPKSPFAKQTVLVPNSGMQRYLQLQLTKRYQLLAHIEITYLGHYFWKQQITQPLQQLPDERALAYAIDALLVQPKRVSARLLQRLQFCHTKRHRFAWAKAFARLLLTYAKQRQAWLHSWQSGEKVSKHPDEAWQRDLFLQLLPDFPNLLLVHAQRKHNPEDILHVFGFHSMPESQRMILWQTAERQSVIFYLLNPSSEYWLQLSQPTQAFRAQLAKKNADESFDDAFLHHDIGNPLLANWGRAGRYLFTRLLEDATWHDVAQNELIQDDHLHQLQASINALTSSLNSSPRNDNDDSITLHACANARREIEVLFDWICQQLAEYPNLKPSDFLVMMPNIGDYTSHIHAVFDRSVIKNYSVANQTEAASQPEVSAFLSLLCVIGAQFSVSAFFDFCAQPAVAKVFTINTQDLSTFRQWLTSANVNWGVTPKQKALHVNDNMLAQQGSLQKVVDELNLAHLFGETTQPVTHLHYRATQLVSLLKLNDLVTLFSRFSDVGSQIQSLSLWHQTLLALAKACQFNDADVLIKGITAWFEVLEHDSEHPYSFDIIRSDLDTFFASRELHGPFLSGGVTFCSMQPMRAIPASRICMLGMNQDVPTPEIWAEYDLRKTEFAAYDVLRHDEQKYLMLETILSARDKLYLSYQGIDEYDAKPLPPSPLLAELVQFFARSDISLPHKTHPLQRVSEADDWLSFVSNRNIGRAATHKLLEINIDRDLRTSFSVMELATYLVAPLQAYCDQNRIRLARPNQDLSDFEMLLPDKLDQYYLNRAILNEEKNLMAALRQQNRAPASVLATTLLTQQRTSLKTFQQAHSYNMQGLLPQCDVDTEVLTYHTDSVNYYIQFNLTPLYGSTRYLYNVSLLKLKTLVEAWLTQLCAQLAGESLNTTLLFRGKKNQVYQLNLGQLENVEALLRQVLLLINQCQIVPVPAAFKLKLNKMPQLFMSALTSLERSLIPYDCLNLDTKKQQDELEKILKRIISDFDCA